MNDIRPVWLSREQIELLTGLGVSSYAPIRYLRAADELRAAWNAAPADAVDDVKDHAGISTVESDSSPQ